MEKRFYNIYFLQQGGFLRKIKTAVITVSFKGFLFPGIAQKTLLNTYGKNCLVTSVVEISPEEAQNYNVSEII